MFWLTPKGDACGSTRGAVLGGSLEAFSAGFWLHGAVGCGGSFMQLFLISFAGDVLSVPVLCWSWSSSDLSSFACVGAAFTMGIDPECV